MYHFDNCFNFYTKCHINGTLTIANSHMRDATECINSIGHGLFVAINAIFSKRNNSELVMNFIQQLYQ